MTPHVYVLRSNIHPQWHVDLHEEDFPSREISAQRYSTEEEALKRALVLHLLHGAKVEICSGVSELLWEKMTEELVL